MARIHILVDREDKLRYEAQAAREGKSLGAWIREAAEERYRAGQQRAPFEARDELTEFFARCDAAEPDREPDWEAHRRVLERSRTSDLEAT